MMERDLPTHRSTLTQMQPRPTEPFAQNLPICNTDGRHNSDAQAHKGQVSYLSYLVASQPPTPPFYSLTDLLTQLEDDTATALTVVVD